MKIKRIVVLFLAVCMLLPILASCAGDDPAPPAPVEATPAPVADDDVAVDDAPAPVEADANGLSGELLFWNTAGTPEERAYWADVIARFNEIHPNVTITYETMEGEAYSLNIGTRVAANDLPDIFNYWVGERFQALVSTGNVMELSGMLSANPDFANSFVPGTLDEVAIDGRIYGIPDAITCMALFYNRRLFEEAGVSVPNTIDELMDAIQGLNDAGITPIVVGAMDRWPLLGWYAYIAQRLGGYELYYEITQNGGSFAHPLYVEAAEIYRDIAEQGFINGALAIDAGTADALFAAGQGAMMVMGAWSIGVYTADPETAGDFGFIPFPIIPGAAGEAGFLYGGLANVYAVSNSTNYPEAAKAFLQFIMSEENVTRRVEITGNAPTVNANPVRENMNPLAYEFSNFVTETVMGFFPYTDQALPPEVAERLLNAMVAIIADPNIDIEETLRAIQG